jgi:hypothetical protein
MSNPVNFTIGGPPASIAFLDPPVWQAGAPPFPLAIHGSGFGNAPGGLTISGVGVTYTTPATVNATGTEIDTTVTVNAASPVGNVAEVSVTPVYAGSSFICGTCNGGSAVGMATAPINPIIPPTPTIVSGSGSSGVCNSGTPITSQQNVVVGQPITFTGCVPSAVSALVANESWSPDSKFSVQSAVSGFSVSFDGSTQFTETLTQISPSACSTGQYCDFNKFYFVTPGTYTFTYSYTLGNGTPSASKGITFVVAGPAPDSQGNFMEGSSSATPPTAGPVKIFGVGQYFGQLASNATPELANGDGENTNGIELTITGTAPTGFTDSGWRFVQTINQLSYSFKSSPQSSPFVIQPGLDTLYPNSSANVLFQDSPGMVLDATNFGKSQFTSVGEEAETSKFTTYLSWDPQIAEDGSHNCTLASSQQAANGGINYSASTCVSIPIPMASLTWGFAGDAIKTLNPMQGIGTNAWILNCVDTYSRIRSSWLPNLDIHG